MCAKGLHATKNFKSETKPATKYSSVLQPCFDLNLCLSDFSLTTIPHWFIHYSCYISLLQRDTLGNFCTTGPSQLQQVSHEGG